METIKIISKEIRDMVENIATVEEMSKVILSSATQCLDVSRNVGCTVEEQLASIEEVSSSAALLSGMAEDLNSSISSFNI
ncbi:hypothetical protein [Clostridium thailandense]|uniref:hypothetical protein n=1 Tax=Clostridium thailandense TaxID=2794346 RepID=UPI003989E11D